VLVMARLARPRGPDGPHGPDADEVSAATRVLHQAGGACPACQAERQATERFFFWFVAESYQYGEMRAKLRASLGLCPPHTRRLLRDPPAGVLITTLRGVVAAAIRRLDKPRAAGPCPACQAVAEHTGHAIGTLLAGLGDAAVADGYRAAGGLCLPHGVTVLAPPAPAEHRLLASVLAECLAARSGPESEPEVEAEVEAEAEAGAGRLLELLAGGDPDGPAHRWLRSRLPAPEGQPPSGPASGSGSGSGSGAGRPSRATLQRLGADLEVDACPACLAGARAERRYLDWLVTSDKGQTATSAWEATQLCPRHLCDVTVAAPGAGSAFATRSARRWQGELQRFLAALEAEISPRMSLRGWLGTLPAVWRASWRQHGGWHAAAWLRAAAKETLARRPRRDRGRGRGRDRDRRDAFGLRPQPYACAACQAYQRGERRALALLLAALGDREVAARYEVAHGLCVRHALAQPGPEADGRAALPRRVVREVVRARLDVLAWELAELDEKRAWSLRYDPARTEADAWLRALALLDGRIFGGGPAVRRSRSTSSAIPIKARVSAAGRADNDQGSCVTSASVPAPGGPPAHGAGRAAWLPLFGRGNGLDAPGWAPLADVGEEFVDALLAAFREAGVPAHTAPSASVCPSRRARPQRRRRSRPTTSYRVWVGALWYATAEDVLRTELPRLAAEHDAT